MGITFAGWQNSRSWIGDSAVSKWTFTAGSLALNEGCFRLQVIGTASRGVDLIDMDDRARGARLSAGGTYYLKLRKPMPHAEVCEAGETSSMPDGSSALLKVQECSPARFLAAKIFGGLRRHALQNFAPGEKLVAGFRKTARLPKAAADNVEFRALRLYGLDDNSHRVRNWGWMERGWPSGDGPTETARETGSQIRACVYLHMHYWQTWDEIEQVLLNDCQGLQLIVTSTAKRELEFNRIRARFPDSQVIVAENRGRDVGPFMQLLKDGVFDSYDAVCKIHGKLSLKNGQETVSGLRIRRYILASLLADGACARALEAFHRDERLGMLGPRALLLPRHGPATRHIKTERRQMERIFRRAGAGHIATENARFFAGTMFWFRPAALEHLRKSAISINDFDPENGAKRNTLQHAMERVFGLFVEDAGYRIASLEPGEMNGAKIELEYV